MQKVRFQLTRSRGAWQLFQYPFRICRWFQLTRSRGAWHRYTYYSISVNKFQLTRSRGAWLEFFDNEMYIPKISTHTLTWSVTSSCFKYIIWQSISTHTLTWSVTRKWGFKHMKLNNFNSHAHVERDAVIWPKLTLTLYFNSHAHVERDVASNNITIKEYVFQLTRSRGAWLGKK